MTHLGIIRNPRSRGNQRGTLDPESLGEDVILRQPASHRELEVVMDEFAARRVDVIAIDGGDGTIRDVLSAAIPAFEELPSFALLASGKTNVIAANVGSWGTGRRALPALAAAARSGQLAGRRQHWRTLQLSFANRRLHGFVFGAGAYQRGKTLTDTGFIDRMSGSLRVAATIGCGVLAVSRRRERQVWLAGTQISAGFGDEDEAPASHPRFLFMATTLKRFMLGIWPFWQQDDGPIRYLEVDARPRRLATALLPVLRGKPRPWMAEAGYRSGSTMRIRLRFDETFILDGESYQPGADGVVLIEAGPSVAFIRR